MPHSRVGIGRGGTNLIRTDDANWTQLIEFLAWSLRRRIGGFGRSFDFRKAENCDEVQGSLFGRPEDIEKYRPLTDGSAASIEATVISLNAEKRASTKLP